MRKVLMSSSVSPRPERYSRARYFRLAQLLFEEGAGAFVHLDERAAERGFLGLRWPGVLLLGQCDAELLRDRAYRFRKGDVLDLLAEAENISRNTAPEAVIELFGRMHRERTGLFLVEGTEPAEILRACLLQLDVIADDADDVRLLLHRVREIARISHGTLAAGEHTSPRVEVFILGCHSTVWCR